ncbi:MAG TPA: hypothetical protein VIK89_12690 [Cytophagaceae bacterium]
MTTILTISFGIAIGVYLANESARKYVNTTVGNLAEQVRKKLVDLSKEGEQLKNTEQKDQTKENLDK